MKSLDKIKKWPVEKKRKFSFFAAIILTILIIVLNSAINVVWKDETQNNFFSKYSPIQSTKESIMKVLNQFGPSIESAISSTSELIKQNTSTTSGFSTTTNVVR